MYPPLKSSQELSLTLAAMAQEDEGQTVPPSLVCR